MKHTSSNSHTRCTSPCTSGNHKNHLNRSLIYARAHHLKVSALKHDTASTSSAVTRLAQQAATAVLAASLALSGPSFAADGPKVVRLPASADPQLFAVQKTLVEAWTIVQESFVDSHFNGHDWEEELKQHMNTAFAARDPDHAYSEISTMLSDLGDPYTRIVPPEEYASFRVSADGELQGVGLLIANEPVNNHLLVLAPIRGGPADRAGMLPGDEVLSINGESTDGWSGEKAANLLRGRGGTAVKVKFVRHSEGIPGVPGRPEPLPSVQFKEVTLQRETVAVSPVYSTLIPVQDANVGYIKLSSFSNNAASEVARSVDELKARGADSFILDLRNNPGGLVRAGMDVARIWLDGKPVIFNISGRSDEGVQQVALETEQQAQTHDPLVVLVNENSASASEILSGALHDAGRATVMGSTTFGKGRIQSVYELQDGSALFVTVAKYQTPLGTEIDLKGIHPDAACLPPLEGARSKLDAALWSGLPVGAGTEDSLLDMLGHDGCMLAAEKRLIAAHKVQAATAAVAQQLPRTHAM